MLKRMTGSVALILTLAACTPNQVSRFWAAVPIIGFERANQVADEYAAERSTWVEGRSCPYAYDYAIEAGFRPDQWPTLSMLCWRESRGSLTAVSSTHDYCWWQINRSAHEGRLLALGIIENGMSDLLTDGQRCANAAYDVWNRAGWTAWVTYSG